MKKSTNNSKKKDSKQSTSLVLEEIQSRLLKKLPPQNIEAEQAVLGGVFLNPSIFDSLIDIIKEEDFYLPSHQKIFHAFMELYDRNVPVDLVTVAELLEKKGELEDVGGAAYLASLAESVASSANAVNYAHIVKEKSLRRELIKKSLSIIQTAFESDEDIDTILGDAEQGIFEISESKIKPSYKSSKELVNEVFEYLENKLDDKGLVTGVPSGYSKLDELTAGFQPSDFIVVAGRPSMGKTAFGLNVAMRAAILHRIPTAIFSLEMSMDQIMMRMLCAWAKVDLSKLRRGRLKEEEWTKLYQAAQDLSEAPIYIDDTPTLEPVELRARCRRLKSDKDIGLVVIDYLQLMHVSQKRDSREQEIALISRNMKYLAKEVNVPVVALAQLNRKVEERRDKRPMLSDLRESGAIEQDADVIIFLYRDEVYNPNKPESKGIAELIIGKQRNGPVGVVKLSYLSFCTAFENLADAPVPSEDINF